MLAVGSHTWVTGHSEVVMWPDLTPLTKISEPLTQTKSMIKSRDMTFEKISPQAEADEPELMLLLL